MMIYQPANLSNREGGEGGQEEEQEQEDVFRSTYNAANLELLSLTKQSIKNVPPSCPVRKDN